MKFKLYNAGLTIDYETESYQELFVYIEGVLTGALRSSKGEIEDNREYELFFDATPATDGDLYLVRAYMEGYVEGREHERKQRAKEIMGR